VCILCFRRGPSHVPSVRFFWMRVLKYEIDIFWSEEDAAYVAVVPDLPHLSAHGLSYEEALEEIQEAMRFFLEVIEKRGAPIPEPRSYPASKRK
jgi:predicted RNase H-like HicB family nuclease